MKDDKPIQFATDQEITLSLSVGFSAYPAPAVLDVARNEALACAPIVLGESSNLRLLWALLPQGGSYESTNDRDNPADLHERQRLAEQHDAEVRCDHRFSVTQQRGSGRAAH